MRNDTITPVNSPLFKRYYFFLLTFKSFFVISFQEFNYLGASWCDFPWTYCVWDLLNFLESVGLCLLPNLGCFQILGFGVLFQTSPTLLFFWDSDEVIGVLVPEALLVFNS